MQSNQYSVLVAENNPLHQSQLANVFRRLGISIDIVTDGAALDGMLNRQWYSHIFVDSNLAQLNISQLNKDAKAFKANHEKPSYFIKLTSGSVDKLRAVSLFDDMMQKPLKLEHLEQCLEIHDVAAGV